MKLYVPNPLHLSRAMGRVAHAFIQHSPNHLTLVNSERAADIVLLHVIGFTGLLETIQRLRSRDQKFAIMQYCIRSTERPHTADWLPIWQDPNCLAVWSYYDLKQLMREDCIEGDFNFYYAPLGADDQIFSLQRRESLYTAFATGYVASSECLGEVAQACANVGGFMAHIGCDLKLGSHVINREAVTDAAYTDLLSKSRYVTGLRRCEGFELPAAEGLLCGTRPVLFDAPHYKNWFGEFAEYIPETDAASVTDCLTELFKQEPRPITLPERAAAVETFDWKRLVSGFYGRMR